MMLWNTAEIGSALKWLIMCYSKAFLLHFWKMTNERRRQQYAVNTLAPMCTIIRFQAGCNWPDTIRVFSEAVTQKHSTISSMVTLTTRRSVRAAGDQDLLGSGSGAALEQSVPIYLTFSFSSVNSHISSPKMQMSTVWRCQHVTHLIFCYSEWSQTLQDWRSGGELRRIGAHHYSNAGLVEHNLFSTLGVHCAKSLLLLQPEHVPMSTLQQQRQKRTPES